MKTRLISVATATLTLTMLCQSSATYADSLVLAGGSASPNSVYGYLGALLPVGTDLGQPGFVARLWASGLRFDYDSASVGEVRGRGPEFEAALGHLWAFGDNRLTFYAGVKYRHIHLQPKDPDSDAERRHWGVSTQLDLYQRFSQSWGLSAIAGYTALVHDYWIRARPTFNAGPVTWGPEAIFAGGDEYTDNRYGLFVDRIPLGALQLGISGGVEREHGRGTDPYGAISLAIVF